MILKALIAGILVIEAAASIAATSRAQVTVNSGSLRGASDHGVMAFKGIPFAAPPVGVLRWREPQPVRPWQGVRAATQFSAACYQGKGAPFGPFTAEFVIGEARSEDCLYLNVWTPAAAPAHLPVLVFIHGGGFGSGATSIPIYDGAGLAAKGAVVVTLNYRVGVFGFLAHPALSAESPLHSSGNYGILDMIAALRWVRANIARFGGDPANVTISGQSAGAAAIGDLLEAPAAKGLFQRAIIQSGPGLGVHMLTQEAAERNGADIMTRLKLNSVQQLRAMSAADIAIATGTPPPSAGGGVPRILLAPNVDGRVITRNPDNVEGVVVSDVPVIAGYNRDEAYIFGTPTVTPEQFSAAVEQRYGNFAPRFLAIYPHATAAEATRSMDEIGRDRYMSQLVLWAEHRATGQTSPFYLYQFDHSYPGLDAKRFGAFHTAEVPYIMGALDIPGITFTAGDRLVADQMQQYWLTFMTSGNPNPAGSTTWPNWRDAPGRMMMLGDQARPAWPVSSKERFDVFRDYVASGGELSLF